MSEQIPPQENAAAETPAPKPHKISVADIFARVSITQMTLAVLVVIFLLQWFDGHRAIGEMRQQLAEKIAEMDEYISNKFHNAGNYQEKVFCPEK